jgi:hypothetical protein
VVAVVVEEEEEEEEEEEDRMCDVTKTVTLRSGEMIST